LDDALRGGLITPEDIPAIVIERLGATHARRIDTLVTDIVTHSDSTTPPGAIAISPEIKLAADALRDFLYDRVYTPLNEEANTHRAQHIVKALFAWFAEEPSRIPVDYQTPATGNATPDRLAADFVASMTDRFAIELYEGLFVPQNWSV
ncbi:MAG: deoxyguanosinetriphosphate triphosphohydrolase, partial [Thermomicrobiales bacterium]